MAIRVRNAGFAHASRCFGHPGFFAHAAALRKLKRIAAQPGAAMTMRQTGAMIA